MNHQPPDSDPDPGPASQDPGPASRLVSSRRLLHVTLLLVLVVPVILWLLRPQTSPELTGATGSEVGAKAPDFQVTLFDGQEFGLSSHLAEDGRPVVLNFWASWCVPCRVEMPAIDVVARQRSDLLFLGIAVQDDEAAARAFADEVGVSYLLGYDSDGTILEAYPILGLPATRIIGADGTVVAQFFGQLDEDTLTDLIDQHS